MAELTVAKIKRKFPKEWKRMQERCAEHALPELPREIERKLEKECQGLLKPRQVEFIPVSKYPFLVECLLVWEEDIYCSLREIVAIRPRKGASKAEKGLIRLLNRLEYDTSGALGEVVEVEIYKSQPARRYNREIKDFCNRGEKLEKKYHFRLTDLIQRYANPHGF